MPDAPLLRSLTVPLLEVPPLMPAGPPVPESSSVDLRLAPGVRAASAIDALATPDTAAAAPRWDVSTRLLHARVRAGLEMLGARLADLGLPPTGRTHSTTRVRERLRHWVRGEQDPGALGASVRLLHRSAGPYPGDSRRWQIDCLALTASGVLVPGHLDMYWPGRRDPAPWRDGGLLGGWDPSWQHQGERLNDQSWGTPLAPGLLPESWGYATVLDALSPVLCALEAQIAAETRSAGMPVGPVYATELQRAMAESRASSRLLAEALAEVERIAPTPPAARRTP